SKIAPKDIGLTPADQGMQRICKKYLERHEWELDRYRPFAFSVYSGPPRPARAVNTHLAMPANPGGGAAERWAILAGGAPFSPTVPVTPGALSCVTVEDNTIPEAIGGRRLEFARWLARADNPVTARSMVNRIWQFHFGRGIVATPNNFGAMGSKPTHP